jgi:hypothetical protein
MKRRGYSNNPAHANQIVVRTRNGTTGIMAVGHGNNWKFIFRNGDIKHATQEEYDEALAFVRK